MSDSDVAAVMRRHLGREARWSYWQDGAGPMFVYNTEPIHTRYGSPADGQYESAVFVPYGPGSRSGRATRFRELEDSRSAHVLRRDAKARALRLYQAWKATGKVTL